MIYLNSFYDFIEDRNGKKLYAGDVYSLSDSSSSRKIWIIKNIRVDKNNIKSVECTHLSGVGSVFINYSDEIIG